MPNNTNDSDARPLNIRQQRFCELVVSGMPASHAYLEAGYQVSVKVAEVSGARLMSHAKVKARIAELRKPQTLAALMTKDEKRAYLARVVRTPIGQLKPDSDLCTEFITTQVAGGSRGRLRRGKAPSGNETEEVPVIQVRVKMADKLRAIEMDSKLAGHFEPEQLVVETGPKTLDAIKERAQSVVSALDRTLSAVS